MKWIGDITYIRTTKGWVYLAVVIDLFSRKIVGWSMSNYVNSTLTCKALENATEQRDQSDIYCITAIEVVSIAVMIFRTIYYQIVWKVA